VSHVLNKTFKNIALSGDSNLVAQSLQRCNKSHKWFLAENAGKLSAVNVNGFSPHILAHGAETVFAIKEQVPFNICKCTRGVSLGFLDQSNKKIHHMTFCAEARER
jgi:hypothetical protein